MMQSKTAGACAPAGSPRASRTVWGAALTVALIATLGGCGGKDDGTPPVAAPVRDLSAKVSCSSLASVTIPASAVGLPTSGVTVTSATMVAAVPQTTDASGNVSLAVPEYCKVLGSIAPVDPTSFAINFQVSLPTTWNDRSMQYGGGGFNGSVISGIGIRYPQPLNDPYPISRGYATYGSDSGHSGNNGAFALNDESLVNFGYQSLKKTKDVAFVMIKAYYGKTPSYSYFNGHSNGGREAHQVVQRFPNDYDGVMAIEPVINWTPHSIVGNVIATAASDGGWMNAAKVKLLTTSTLAACDAQDGVADSIVGKWGACTHDAAVLRCPGGADTGDTCLSDKQIIMVNAIRKPYVFPFSMPNGVTQYPGWGSAGGEANPDAWDRWQTASNPITEPQPSGPGPFAGVATIPFYGQTFVRYFIAKDPNFDTFRFDPSKYQAQIQRVAGIVDSSNPDISAFLAKGGKLLMKENSSDYARSFYMGINYYKSMVAKLGQDTVDKGVRLWVTPGGTHFGNNAATQVDLITQLENWVEKGIPPADNLVAVNMDTTLKVLASRPLCRYPNYPRYNGTGDITVAASYTCTVNDAVGTIPTN